MGLVP